MKLNALRLENFTSYSTLTANFPSTISVIVGSNAAGKTSILDAITYLLTGACARTDRAGKGAAEMVRVGEKESTIAAILNGGAYQLNLGRKIPGGLWIDGHEGTQTSLQDYLYGYLGTSQEALTAALSTHEFIDMRGSGQKSLLFGLLGLSFERGDVIDKVAAEVSEDRLDQVLRALEGAPAECYTGDGQTFERLYKYVFELRRHAKKRLKDLGAPPVPKLLDSPPPKEEVVAQLEALRDEMQEKRLARSRVTIEASARESKQEELNALKALLSKAGDPTSARKQLADVEDAITDLKRDMAAKRAKFEALAEAITALSAEAKECPQGRGLVACPMTKIKREKILEDLSRRKEQYGDISLDLEEGLKLMIPRREELKDQSQLPDRKEVQASIEKLEGELGEGLLETDVTGIETEIEVLGERIAKGESLLAEINRSEGAREAEEKQAAERSSLEDQVELLEQLVEILSPKGLPGRILAEVIGPVTLNANERLGELTGGAYSLEIVPEPDFSIFISHGGIRTDLKRLSSSERQRVGIILQDSIVRLSGLRFLVIDNADLLDPHNRKLLMDLLLAIKADYDTILVLSTIGPLGVTNPGIEDVSVFLLEDGQLKPVEREVAA